MKPYFEDTKNKVRIFNGDCAEVLPQLTDKFDLCLTDPPYGIGSWFATGGNSLSKEEAEAVNFWDIAPEWDTLSACILKAEYSIVWGYNYLGNKLGACRAPVVWDKAIRGMHFADGELAWTNFDWGTLRILSFSVAEGDTKSKRLHPTQKPLQVMKWCIKLLEKKKITSVIDPFCGSGTTLRASIDFGLECVGIEKEEKYCEIAARRCKQQSMFGEPPVEKKPEEATNRLF